MASREPLIEPYRPYESAPTHEFDYEYDDAAEPDPDRGGRPRVLWGRIAALSGIVLLAFLIGRWSAPNGVPEEDLRRARAEARQAQDEAESLRDQLGTLQTERQGLDEEKSDDGGGGGGGNKKNDKDDAAAESQTYTVEAGDTLSTIAEEFYGDSSFDDFLAEANPEVNPYALRVGQELVIPPKPEE